MKINIYFFVSIIFSYLILNLNNISYSQESFKNKDMTIIVSGQDENLIRRIYSNYHTEIIKLQRFRVLQEPNQELKYLLSNSGNKNLDSKTISKIRKFSNNGYINFIEYNFDMTYEEPKNKGEKFKYIFNINAFSKFFDIEKGIFVNSSSIFASGQSQTYESALSNAVSNLVNELLLTTREVFSFKTTVLKRDFWGGKVLLSLGSDDGIKRGLSFKVYENNDFSKQEIGYIKVISTTSNTSIAIIREGFWRIKDGDFVEEFVRDVGKFEVFLSYEYLGINGNRSSLLTDEQKNKFPELNRANLAILNMSFFPSQTETSIGGNIGIGGLFGNGFYNGFIIDGKLLYRWDLIPDFFSLNFNGGPFLYSVIQGKENVISKDPQDLRSLQNAKSFSDVGLGLVLEVNSVLKFGLVRFYSMISYRYGSNLSNWTYTNYPDPNNREKSETISLRSNQSIAYPNISINGLTVGNSIGIAF